MASPATPPPAVPPGAAFLAPTLVVAAGLLAFGGALGAGFVFDDGPALVEHPALAAHDAWAMAFGSYTPLANRPLVCLTFVANHLLGGLQPWGYHLVNVLLHLGNALLLFAVARAVLRGPAAAGRWSAVAATWTAAALAGLWAAHPLAADAVAYATQRTTLLMATCLLTVLWSLVRAAAPGAARTRWQALAIAALAAGMACKEEFAAAPLLVPLFERAFLLPDWRALRARLPFHLGCAATWLVLVACVALGARNPTVGWHTQPPASPWEWLLTQAGVVVHYARLTVWPSPLRGAYDWPIVREPGPAVLPGLAVLAAVAFAASGWRRAPGLAFLLAAALLLLAPTSSILPIVTEVVAERRAYLPMLAVLAPAVVGLAAALRRWRHGAVVGALLAAAVLAAAIAASRARTAVFADEATFWADAFAKNECRNGSFQSATILSNQGLMLYRQQRLGEALALFERAMACEAPTAVERAHYASALADSGRFDEAEARFRTLVAEGAAPAFANLATLLAKRYFADPPERQHGASDARLQEAAALLERALAAGQSRGALWNTLALVQATLGRLEAAEASYRRAIAVEPGRPEPVRGLVDVLVRLGRTAEAEALQRQLSGR